MNFLVTEDHIKLLKNLNIDWDDSSYEGAPKVNIKRPYGNSCLTTDISDILDWKEDFESKEWYEVCQDALNIHREMEIVLQILVSNLKIEPGWYFSEDHRNWEKE